MMASLSPSFVVHSPHLIITVRNIQPMLIQWYMAMP